jgi:2-isopropylmalate synthase
MSSPMDIYDWNEKDRRGPVLRRPPQLLDETLRDGLQSPSVRDPSLEQKMELVRLMCRLGIDAVDLGLPGAGARAQHDVEELLRFVVAERLPIQPNCAARTVRADIDPIVEISQRVGAAVEVTVFIGSSPVRARAEGWDLARLVRHTRDAVSAIVAAGLPASFVTEDTTRSHPAVLDALFRTAIDAGATRLVLCDTCGHATPDGVRSLIGFTRGLLRALDVEDRVALDWHGHNDRGHALTTSLFALEWGVDRVHGCALGIGERVGNAPMDLLLLNLYLLGLLDPRRHQLGVLLEYVRKASEYTGVPIHPAYPLSGRDAFRTATGVHASAVVKAARQGDDELVDGVYSSVPARVFGRHQEIEIGHQSGRSNVVHWLEAHGLEATDEAVTRVLAHAKRQDHTLDAAEILAVLHPVMHPSDARRRCLAQHDWLRAMLLQTGNLARELLGGQPVDHLFEVSLRRLRDAYTAHNAFELAVLEPMILDDNAVGAARVARMVEEHAAEHAALEELLIGSAADVAARFDEFAELVDAHMAAEERTFLSTQVLHDRGPAT